MKRVTPKVYLVGETTIIRDGMNEFLTDIGAGDYTSNAPSDIEELIEFYGRACYNSFKPGLNANVSKIREDNGEYLGNIIKSGHGSVTEHCVVNFIMTNVSRVFTHELVRHRVGTAISQESLRYVRLTDLKLWLPSDIESKKEIVELFEEAFENAEELQLKLAEVLGLDKEGMKFSEKKKLTSAMRRVAPIGLGTVIGWSANIRTLRWLLENRTARHAEEEIRLVFGHIGDLLIQRYPHLFSDFKKEMVDGFPEFKPEYSKI